MNPFPLPIDGKWLGPRRFKLDTKFIYEDVDIRVVVPAGFITDFNSSPRIIWSYFAPTDCLEAGLVHDWLYANPNGLTRQQCDDIHRRILHLCGFRLTKRNAIYTGLRVGGWVPWNKYRAQDIVGQSPSDHKSEQNTISSIENEDFLPRKIGKQVNPGTK